MAAVALAAVALPAGSGSAGPSPDVCNPKGSRTIVENREARVYKLPDDPKYTRGFTIEACEFATNRAVGLDDGAFDFAFRPPGMRLERSLLAFGWQFDTDPNEGENQVIVELVDLRRGAADGGPYTVASRDAWPPTAEDHVVKIGSIAFNRRGSMAWIACPASDASFNAVGADNTDLRPNCVRAGALDSVLVAGPGKGAAVRRVASGRGIAPGSLRRRGSRVTWIQNGRRRSTALPD
jgi:hypothetical protein